MRNAPAYARLTREERYHVETSLGNGQSIRVIAIGMGRSPSTISRELKRNGCGRGCRHRQAQRRADERLSPEQTAGRLAMQGLAALSHAAIYSWPFGILGT